MLEGQRQRRTTTTTTIKLILFCFLLFASFSNLHDGIVNVEAFVAPKALLVLSPPTSSLLSSSSASSTASSDIFDTSNNNNNDDVDILQASTTFKHADVEWKIQPWFRPEPESSSSDKKEKKIRDKLKRVWVSSKFLRKKLMLKAAANIIRLDCFLKKRTAPKVLCPKGGQAVLEAFVVNKDKNKRSGLGGLLKLPQKAGKFGITTHRGPPCPEVIETIQDLYNIGQQNPSFPVESVGVAAIIYMYIEPEYRSHGIGELALDVISSLHAIQNCDFTILVADDDGSGKLVNWYLQNGFQLAPKLQNIMGSPDGIYGITMIRPTFASPEFYDNCQIKWW